MVSIPVKESSIFPLFVKAKIISPEIRMFIELGNFVAVDDRPGFEDWAESHRTNRQGIPGSMISISNLHTDIFPTLAKKSP